jgi:hypothetical protein
MGREILRGSGHLFPVLRRFFLEPTSWCNIIFPELESIEYIRVIGFLSRDETMYVDLLFESALPETCVVEWDVTGGHLLFQIDSHHVVPRIVMNVPCQTFSTSPTSPPIGDNEFHFQMANSLRLIRKSNKIHKLDIVSPGSNIDEIYPFLQHYVECDLMTILT